MHEDRRLPHYDRAYRLMTCVSKMNLMNHPRWPILSHPPFRCRRDPSRRLRHWDNFTSNNDVVRSSPAVRPHLKNQTDSPTNNGGAYCTQGYAASETKECLPGGASRLGCRDGGMPDPYRGQPMFVRTYTSGLTVAARTPL